MSGIMTLDDAQYAYDIVEAICSQLGPGLPCNPQELGRATMNQFDARAVVKYVEPNTGVDPLQR